MPRNIKTPVKKSSARRQKNRAIQLEGSKLEQKIDQSFSLKKIEPMTDAQQDVFDAFDEGYNLVLSGAAGTGKSFICLYLALRHVINNKNEGPSKIVIIRSTVATRDVGHLPGTLEDKISVYAEPYKAIVNSLFKRGDAWSILVTKKVIEFCSTSYLRGTTIDNSFIFVDEYSNLSFHELETVMTRAGKNTRLLYAGDTVQTDLLKDKEKEGHKTFIKILDTVEAFDLIEFTVDDIVRSGIVKEYLLAKHKLGL